MIARWTIGSVTAKGFECLKWSVESFRSFHDCEVVVCFNCDQEQLPPITNVTWINQHKLPKEVKPEGVAWKLYPPRLDLQSHEILIDNDIIFNEPIQEIADFISGDHTLLLEGESRNYGRFDRYVGDYKINSGIYGMPPGFDLSKYIKLFFGENRIMGKQWEINAFGEHASSRTFDEQGLVATALLDHKKFVIISSSTITNCERRLIEGKANHFVGLNRRKRHEPYLLFKNKKMLL